MKNNENVEPGRVKWWLTLIIAVLTAIAGAIGESATGCLSSIF